LAAGLAEPDERRAQRRVWGDLRLRTLSAVALAPLALAAIWVGGPATAPA